MWLRRRRRKTRGKTTGSATLERGMLRRAAILVVLTAAFAPPAGAQGTQLMPGVTYDRTVAFTPHGVVVMHVITAPRPGRALRPRARARPRRARSAEPSALTQIERDVSAAATVAGIERRLLPLRRRSPERRLDRRRGTRTARRSGAAARSASTRVERCASSACGSSAPGRAPVSGAAVRAQRAAGAGPDRPLHPRVRASHPGRRAAPPRSCSGSFPGDRAEHRPRRDRDGDRVRRRRADPARRRRADGGRSYGTRLLKAEAPVGTADPQPARSCNPTWTV